MDNWRSAQGGVVEPTMDSSGTGWKTYMPPGSRERIVNKIMDTLRMHVSFCGQEGLQEMEREAIRFEEKIYDAATSQSDYLRKISLKMLRVLETMSQNTMPSSLLSNNAYNSSPSNIPSNHAYNSSTSNIPSYHFYNSSTSNMPSYHAYSSSTSTSSIPSYDAYNSITNTVDLPCCIFNSSPSNKPSAHPYNCSTSNMPSYHAGISGNSPNAGTSMDTNNWSSAQGAIKSTMDIGSSGADWRTHLPPNARQEIVNKIMDTLKRHLPFSGQEGLQKLEQIASRFEEKIYTVARSQSDYLRKISLNMLTMEPKSQNTMATSLPANSAINSKNPPDEGIYTLEDIFRLLEI